MTKQGDLRLDNLSFTGLYSSTSGLYTLIDAIGDSVFYFFPVVIGYTSAKKLSLRLLWVWL